MRIAVTGSTGHLGEALVRVLRAPGVRDDVVGLDLLPSPWTAKVGSIADRDLVREFLAGADAVIHTATLHKPHIGTHDRSSFVATNVTGTLTIIEEAVEAGVGSFVFVSTTSTYGRAIQPGQDGAAVWVDESLIPVPKNIYGATKVAAEDLCELVHRESGIPCVVLRTSRFFPEGDDDQNLLLGFDGLNLKVNELLYRRVDIEDAVSACRLAVDRAPDIGFGRYIVSATTPFTPDDLRELGRSAPDVVKERYPEYPRIFDSRGWRMLSRVDRVYDNAAARNALSWQPRYDFGHALNRLAAGEDPRSQLALTVGSKGYHSWASAQRAGIGPATPGACPDPGR